MGKPLPLEESSRRPLPAVAQVNLGNPVFDLARRLLLSAVPAVDFPLWACAGVSGAMPILSLISCAGMEFAAEMVVKARARLRKLRVTEVPTTLSPDGRSPAAASANLGATVAQSALFGCFIQPRFGCFFYPGLAFVAVGCRRHGVDPAGYALRLSESASTSTLLVSPLRASSVASRRSFSTMFAKTYAIRSGLLPADPLVTRTARRSAPRDRPLGGKGRRGHVGVVLAALAVGNWENSRFSGHLDPANSRYVSSCRAPHS